jgi:hypothetical protein
VIRFGALALLFSFALFGRSAAAQEAVNYASISGRVTDATGATLSAADVVVRHVDTNVSTTTATGVDGRFRFPYLRVGPYEISVHKTGFADLRRSLTLTAGSAFELPISLALATVETDVAVTAEAPLLETARSQIATTVTQREISNLPLNGRHTLDVALFAPGVSPTNVGGSGQLFPETSAVPGVGLSVNSQRNFSNNYLVDGLSANDDAAGLSGLSLGPDAVGEIQVVTTGAQAELGRALGGYISIVTKSGTNRLTGDAYLYQRDDALNARNALSGTKLPMRQSQFGFSAGGPLSRDRTFYFLNIERRNLDQTGLTTIDAANVSTINTELAEVGYGGQPVATGEYPQPVRATHVTAKVDHHLSGNDHLSVRYSLYDVNAGNSRGAGALSAPSASAGLDNADHAIAVGHVRSLTPTTVLETRGQFAYGDLQAPPTDPFGPSVNIQGVAAFGRLTGNPTGRVNRMYEVVANLSHQAGAHAFRGGLDAIHNDLTITFPRATKGSYTFSSLQNFLTGLYSNQGFTQTFGDTSVDQTNPNLGLYVQDEWKVRPDVTLNLGLRYDLQWMETIATDTNNVSPRIGVAWSPFGDGRTIVRASGGLFFDRVPLRATANALLSAGNTTDVNALRQTNVSLSPAQAGAPIFPNILDAVVPTVTLVNFTTMDAAIQNAQSRQVGVEVERRIGAQSTLSVGFDHLTGRQLIAQLNRNAPTCPVVGTNNGCRPNPAFANNSQYAAAGRSSYDGLRVSWLQRPTRWGSYRVSYTLSKSMNNVGEAFFNGPIDPLDIESDWGPSDDDQRHRLMATASVDTPSGAGVSGWSTLVRDLNITGVVQYYSALPFNITSGVTTVQGTAGRPIVDGEYIQRNAGRRTALSTVGLRVSRSFAVREDFRLEAVVEAFNLLNRANETARNTTFGTGAYPESPLPTFGQVTAVGEPRAIQIGVRARF